MKSIYPSKFENRSSAIEFIENVWSTHRLIHPFSDSLTSKKYGVWLCHKLLKSGKLEMDEQLRIDIHSILSWAVSTSPNISQLSFEEALKSSISWKKKKIVSPIIDMDRVIIHDDNGYFLYDLRKDDFKYEGHMMGHCVSTYEKSYKFKDNILVSLRDRFNKPHVTFESSISKENPEISTIIQQFGNGNHPISDHHMSIVINLLSKYFLLE